MRNTKVNASDEALAGAIAGVQNNKQHHASLPYRVHYTGSALNRKAARIYSDALHWRQNNVSTWSDWSEQVKKAVDNQQHWSIAALVEASRHQKRHEASDSTLKVSNNLKAAFSRMLCSEIPGAYRYVTLRQSIFERT